MACSFCYTDGLPAIPSAGECVICNRSACTLPSVRYDKKTHGHFCECSCNQFVCHVHYQSHSRKHPGGGPAKCFPAPTAVVSGTTLAVIEDQIARPLDMLAPIGDLDNVLEFILRFASTPEHVRIELASSEGPSAFPIADDLLRERLHKGFMTKLSLTYLAPVVIELLRSSVKRLRDTNSLPFPYGDLKPRMARMDVALARSSESRNPMSRDAIAAYAELSPRIAEALAEVAASDDVIRFDYPADMQPFFTVSQLRLGEVHGRFAALRSTPAALSALLPGSRLSRTTR